MDVSVLAAVGSFVVSERVLKPKATVLVILGCVLAYDLTTKTRDPSSLRVYRGPALIAFTLMMAAYSLRTWRRNGVACDELIFLPGTAHGEYYGIDNPPNTPATAADDDNGPSTPIATNKTSIAAAAAQRSNEGDVAAGVGLQRGTFHEEGHISQLIPSNSQRSVRNRIMSKDSSISSIQEFENSWNDDEETRNSSEVDDANNDETVPLNRDIEIAIASDSNDAFDNSNHILRSRSRSLGSDGDHEVDGPVQRFQQNHPQITRIGSFFFFRSSATSTQNADYAPSGPSVVGAALDLSMPTLFNFHLFIEAFNHMGDSTPAKILPLIFLTILMFRCSFPPKRRCRFYNTLKYTFMAPFHHSRFRDSYIGDVLTSLVRPFQDVMFALSYYVTVIAGTSTGQYGLSTSGKILETSRLLHNVILPSVALLPLWFKFFQTLREAYDHGQRWPYLGNAFKYLSAALVILYGMTHPEDRRSPLWLICFALTLIYQVFWDVVMDWELLVIVPRASVEEEATLTSSSNTVNTCWCTNGISSFHPNSHILLAMHRNIIQPLHDGFAWCLRRIPHWKQIQLRQRRLYKKDSFYWYILAYNVFFRFTWMLCFIPAYHFSASGQEQVTFSSDTKNYVGVLLPVVEILRRTFWGFLYLEMKTIKMLDRESSFSSIDDDDGGILELTVNGFGTAAECASSESSKASVDSSKAPTRYVPTWLGINQHIQIEGLNTTRVGDWFKLGEIDRRRLFLAELTAWAVAFVVLGFCATR